MRDSSRIRASARVLLPAAVAAALGAFAVPAAAQSSPPGLAIEQVPALLAPDAFAAPDGAIWNVARDATGERSLLMVTRVGAEGVRTSTVLAQPDPGATAVEQRGSAQPLADGTVGVVVAQSVGSRTSDVRLMRVDSAGAVVGTTSLPQPARRAAAFAIEPDGGLWWARSCADELYHRTAAGSVERVRLSAIGCGGDLEREEGASLTLGTDGAVWLVNLCKRRIARVAVDGRVREWRPRAGGCRVGDYELSVRPATVTATPDGGISYDGMGSGNVSGDGQLTEGTTVPPRPEALPDGRTVDLVVAGRGGTTWVLASAVHSEWEGRHQYLWRDRPLLQLLAADGAASDWSLEPVTPSEPRISVGPALTGPDGALWLDYTSRAGPLGPHTPRLLRITPPGLAPARLPVTRVIGPLARSGRTVTLQLSCEADLGRWCAGSVRLGGAAAPVRFVVAGERHGAVRLALGARAARTLRRRGLLRTTAIVRGDGAEATAGSIVLRAPKPAKGRR